MPAPPPGPTVVAVVVVELLGVAVDGPPLGPPPPLDPALPEAGVPLVPDCPDGGVPPPLDPAATPPLAGEIPPDPGLEAEELDPEFAPNAALTSELLRKNSLATPFTGDGCQAMSLMVLRNAVNLVQSGMVAVLIRTR
ncbi:MAG TPA: hypothetical protein VND65_11260 [Candidatus Binatia bacterium]|nr:hypothetical protein [Candidatus Binatia bacterium]